MQAKAAAQLFRVREDMLACENCSSGEWLQIFTTLDPDESSCPSNFWGKKFGDGAEAFWLRPFFGR
jgi:hypothetical protein